MMVSGKVKWGQRVLLLWSVCVVCLLPADVVSVAKCIKVEFPTAKNGIITVLENQNVAIPFSLNPAQTCQSVIITVSKMNKTNNTFTNFCKLHGIQSIRKERCKTEPGHGNYSVTKLIDRSDETLWRWRVTHSRDHSDTTVSLRVIRSTGASNNLPARFVLIGLIVVFAIIVVTLGVLLVRRRYGGRTSSDSVTKRGGCVQSQIHWLEPTVQYRPDPPGSENENEEGPTHAPSANSEDLPKTSEDLPKTSDDLTPENHDTLPLSSQSSASTSTSA